MQNTVLLCETIFKNCPAIAANSCCNAVNPEGTFSGAAVADCMICKKNSFTLCSVIKIGEIDFQKKGFQQKLTD